MADLTSTFLPELTARHPAFLPASPRFLAPNYDGYSLANLPAGICRWLGVPAPQLMPALAEPYHSTQPGIYDTVILLLVDGLGLSTFQRLLAEPNSPLLPIWQPLLKAGHLAALTSITPSTTAAALTTLWTGAAPSQHGVIGYELWLKEYGVLTNMITHSAASYAGDTGGLKRAGFNPETFLPIPTLGERFAQNGVSAKAYQDLTILNSGLSSMLMNQVERIGFRTPADLWVSLLEQLQSTANAPAYHYIYWGAIDELSHRYGPDDRRVELEWLNFSRLLAWWVEQVRGHLPGKTLFLMTADHGQTTTPLRPEFNLRNHPELLSCLSMLPSSESRQPYLFMRPGREQSALEYIRRTWPGNFHLIPGADFLQSGVLGPTPAQQTLDRLGDWVVTPEGQAYFWWSTREDVMRGRHGGFSPEEMLIPLFMLEL